MDYTSQQTIAILKSLLLIIHADNIRSIQEQQFLRWFSIQHNEPLEPLLQKAESMTMEEMKEQLYQLDTPHFREVQNLWYTCSTSDGVVPEELQVIRDLAIPAATPPNRDVLSIDDLSYITSIYDSAESITPASYDFLERYNNQRTQADNLELENTFYAYQELLDTLDLYDFDLEAFWNLVLFVKDVVEDRCATAVLPQSSIVDEISALRDAISNIALHPACQDLKPCDELPKDAYLEFESQAELILRVNKKKKHSCANDQAIFLIARACNQLLEEYDSSLLDIPTKPVEVSNTRKLAMYYVIMQQFLHDKEPTTKQTNRSFDKNLLIARVLYVLGWVDMSYAVAYDDTKYTPNRKFYDLIKKYVKHPCEGIDFRSVYYQGVSC